MSWFNMGGFKWRMRKAHTHQLPPELAARVNALPTAAPINTQPLACQRWVVVDVETSGLDIKRDQLLSIGAVVINNGAIQLCEQFECTVQQSGHSITPSTLIHGIAPSQIAHGLPPTQALLSFMQFVGSSPLIAFHAGFDQQMLALALRQSLHYRLMHRFFDVAELAPMLCPEADIRQGSLDDWTAHFNLKVLGRHHASADALATAELALILFSKAKEQQLDSLQALQTRIEHWRRLQRPPTF